MIFADAELAFVSFYSRGICKEDVINFDHTFLYFLGLGFDGSIATKEVLLKN